MGPLDMGPAQSLDQRQARLSVSVEVAQGGDRRPEGVVHTHAH